MTTLLTATELWARFAPGERIGIAGACGEPTGALDALAADPEAGRGLVFAGVWLPGVNHRDPTEGVPEATAEAVFVPRSLRAGFEAGRVRFLPLHYSDAHRWLSGPAGLDAAVLRVTAPVDGAVTPGLACDFLPALLASGAALYAEIDPDLPAPPGAPRVPVERFAGFTEAATPLPVFETGEIPDDLAEIAGRVAMRIRPGDTVQLGIGKAAAAVLDALRFHRGLGYHAGLVTDAMLPHLERDTFSRGIVTGTALGTAPLYEAAGADPRLTWRGVDHTHSHRVIADIPGFKAVNSALEIDLFGQSNGETLRGRQVSGHGGSADFQRGARASEGGEAMVALPATASGGRISRIKPRLEPVSIASIPRADADVVVTEHGVADLRWKGVDARAEALIAIAAPAHQDALADAWAEMRRAM